MLKYPGLVSAPLMLAARAAPQCEHIACILQNSNYGHNLRLRNWRDVQRAIAEDYQVMCMLWPLVLLVDVSGP